MAHGFLPVDIVKDILSRLPTKSLVRFRCICRQWNSLTYDPYFIKSHAYHMANHRATSRILLFCGTKYNNEIKLYDFGPQGSGVTCSSSYEIRFTPSSLDDSLSDELPFPELSEHQVNGRKKGRVCEWFSPMSWPPKQSLNKVQQLVMSNIVNGLICAYDLNRRDCVYLLNPFSRDRELVKLPKGDVEHGLDRIASYGFGFDVSSGKYKLVRISFDSKTRNQYGEIIILGTQEWRYLGEISDRVIPGRRPTYVCGTLCWTSYQVTVLTFDIVEESFGIISMHSLFIPESDLQIQNYRHLCVWGENLYVIIARALNPYLTVMVMKDLVTGQWTNLCDIDASRFLKSGKPYYVRMLGMEDEKIILVTCDYTDKPQVLVLCYDTCSGMLSKLYEDQVYLCLNFELCTETLLSPKTV